jgi:hypothetical protein
MLITTAAQNILRRLPIAYSFMIAAGLFAAGCSGDTVENLNQDYKAYLAGGGYSGPTQGEVDDAFPLDLFVQGGADVELETTFSSGATVYFIPSGIDITSLDDINNAIAAGEHITQAGGSEGSITAPSAEGTYKMYVVDSNGTLSPPSTATLTVDNSPPAQAVAEALFPSPQVVQGGATVDFQTHADAVSTDRVYIVPSSVTFNTLSDLNGINNVTSALYSNGTVTAPTADGTYKLYVVDAAGNVSEPATSILTVDNIQPTLTSVSITSNHSNNSWARTGSVVTLAFTANESLASKPVVTIAGKSIPDASITGGPTTWSASYTMLAGDSEGVIPFTINYTDLVGFAGTQFTTTTNSSSVTFDKTVPVGYAVIIDALIVSVNQANQGAFAFSFTGAEIGTTYNYTISSSGGGTNVTGSAAITSATQTVSAINVAGLSDGLVTLSVTLRDLAGNVGTAPTDDVDKDTIPPANVTGFTAIGGASLVNLSWTNPVTADFNKVLILRNETGTFTAPSNGSTYTQGASIGSSTIVYIGNGTSFENTGRTNDTTYYYRIYAYDEDSAANYSSGVQDSAAPSENPTVTVTTTSPDPTNHSPIPVTITFNKTMYSDAGTCTSTAGVNNFTASDIAVTNGTKGTLSSTDCKTFTINVTPTADGTVTVQVPADVAYEVDKVAWNTVSNTLSRVSDRTAPTSQNTVFPTSKTQQGGSTVTIVSSGEVADSVWFAPAGKTTANIADFVASSQYTKADSGTSTSILAPATAGTYHIYVIDPVGNVSAQSTATLTVDNTVPTVTSVTVPADKTYKLAENLDFVVNFSETVEVTNTTTTLAVTVGTNVRNAAFQSKTATSITYRYTVASNDIDTDGVTVGAITLNSTTITDAALNAANITLNNIGSTLNVKVDGIRPVFTATAPVSNAYVNHTRVSYTLSETIASGSITWERTGGNPDAGSPRVRALTGSELNIGAHPDITLTNNPTLVNGAVYSVKFNGTDAAGNTATEVISTDVTYDTTAPVVAITAPAASTTVKGTETISFTTDSTNPQVSVNGTTWYSASSGTTVFTDIPQFASLAQGGFTLYLRDTDQAGNVGQTTRPFTKDTLPPTGYSVSIGDTKINQVNQNIISFTISNTEGSGTYSYSISSTGGGTPVTGSGSVTANPMVVSNVNVSTLNDGDLTLTVTLTDTVGNTGTPVNDSPTRNKDTIAPANVTGFAAIGGNSQVAMSWTNPADADFNKVIILRNTSSISDAPANGTTYSAGNSIGTSTVVYVGNLSPFTNNTGLTNGTLYFFKIFAYDEDPAANYSSGVQQSATPSSSPTVTISSALTSPTKTSPIGITITFNKTMNSTVVGCTSRGDSFDFTTADIIVGNGTKGTLASSNCSVYTINVTPSGQGAVTVDVPVNSAYEVGFTTGNAAATQFSIVYDSVAPTNQNLVFASSASRQSSASVTILSSATQGDGQSTDTVWFAPLGTTVFTEGANMTKTTGSSVTILAPVTVGTYRLYVVDAAGNISTASTGILTVDNTGPTVSITSSAADPTKVSPVPVTITFNEDVTGFDVSDITITNGTASLSGGPAVYTANITPAGQGEITVTVNAGVAADLAGNSNTASNTLSRVYDSIAPTITSITSITANGYYTQGSSINVRVTLSEPVTLVTGPLNVTLATGSGTTIVAVTAAAYPANILNGTYTVASGHYSTDLDSTAIALAGGTLRDGALNDAVISLPGTTIASGSNIIVDAVVPTVGTVISFGTVGSTSIVVNWGAATDTQVSAQANLQYKLVRSGVAANIDTVSEVNAIVGGESLVLDWTANTLTSTAMSLTPSSTYYFAVLVRDQAGNMALYAPQSQATTAGTPPLAIVSAVTIDSDNNGKIDHYKITFNTIVDDSSFPDYTAHNSQGNVQTQWTIAGYSGVRIVTGSAAPESDTEDDAVIYVRFIEQAGYDTGAKPDLTTTATPGLANEAGIIAQVLTTDVIEADGSKPIIVAADGAQGTRQLKVYFSEAVYGTNAASPCVSGSSGDIANDDLTYVNNNGSGATALAAIDATDRCAADSGFNALFSVDIDFVLTDNLDTVNTSATVFDAAANTGNTAVIVNLYIAEGPTVTKIETFDSNNNGRVEQLKITFSKNMNDSSIIDSDAARFLIGGEAAKLVDTGTGGTGTISAPNDDPATVNDSIVTIFTDDTTVVGTGSLSISFTTNPGRWLDSINSPLTTNSNLSAYIVDKAPPVLISAICMDNTNAAVGIDSDDTVTLTFSESTNKPVFNTISVSTGANLDSVLQISAGHTWGSRDAITSAVWNGAGDQLVVRFTGGGSTRPTIAVGDTIRIIGTIKDTAPIPNESINIAGVEPISGSFFQDTYKPYMVSLSNITQNTVTFKFSEPMLMDGSANAANTVSNYTVAQISGTQKNYVINELAVVSNTTIQLTLSENMTNLETHRVTVATNVVDQAMPAGNTMGDPNYLTFIANENIKTQTVEPVTQNTVRLSFSKVPLAGNNLAGTAGCTNATECNKRYKFVPSLGDVTSAVVGTGYLANTVTLTHTAEQTGRSYTLIVANGINGDGFDDFSWGAIKNSTGSESIPARPLDRVSFTGIGGVVNDLQDGEYFDDPFVDGTTFSYTFNYGNRVYLGTNQDNSAAFRFDPSGANAVTVNFNFSQTGGSCTTTPGFGYITSNITTAPTCGPTGNSGPNDELGVVGFNSVDLRIGGTNYQLLIAGPLKNGISHIYYTQFLDTYLAWKQNAITGTNGVNSKSAQTIYGKENYVFVGISSDHNTNKPIINRIPVTVSGGILTLGSAVDVSAKANATIGSSANANGETLGIDSMYVFNNVFYAANNGGIVYSTTWNQSTFSFSGDSTPAFSGKTLELPDSNTTNGGGLGKINPGSKGIPILKEINGKLYMVRNVAVDATNDTTNLRGELWVCTDANSNNICETTEWARIITGSETDLGSCSNMTYTTSSTCTANGGTWALAKSISMLENNGDKAIYIGFDDPNVGAKVYRLNVQTSGYPVTTGGTTMAGANWASFIRLKDSTYPNILSSTTITDGTSDYLYVIAGKFGDVTKTVKVYRQVD